MRYGKLRRGMGVAVLATVALTAGACSGCADGVFDRMDRWLRDDPERPGKVGTLRALEVRKTATTIAEKGRRSVEGPCGIGWQISEPFSVRFELEIEVGGQHDGRRWAEEGSWQRDAAGRWILDVVANFEDDGELEGRRMRRVFSDGERFLEWLGPEVAVEYRSGSEAELGWEHEFGQRFSALTELHASGWRRVDNGDGDEAIWRPGEAQYWCGPVEAGGELSAWKSLFEARTTLEDVEVVVAGTSSEGGDQKRCRRLRAHHQLRGDGALTLMYRECHQPGPTAIDAPKVERVVDVSRRRDRAGAQTALSTWIEDEIAEWSE